MWINGRKQTLTWCNNFRSRAIGDAQILALYTGALYCGSTLQYVYKGPSNVGCHGSPLKYGTHCLCLGCIDDVYAFGRALTDDEVIALYHAVNAAASTGVWPTAAVTAGARVIVAIIAHDEYGNVVCTGVH